VDPQRLAKRIAGLNLRGWFVAILILGVGLEVILIDHHFILGVAVVAIGVVMAVLAYFTGTTRADETK